MKKFILILLFSASLLLSLTAQAQDSEFRIKINDKISIGTSRSYECVAVISHLAGFSLFNDRTVAENYESYDEYFKKYLSNSTVAKSIIYFQKMYKKDLFSQDVIAYLGTYLNSDCHSYRASDKIIKKQFGPYCDDIKKLLQVVADFYDATDFNDFYQSQLSVYESNIQALYSHKDDLIKCIDALEKYYKKEVSQVFISSSKINGRGNYGISFDNGKTISFEPKFCANYYEPYLFVHELSHPFSNPIADKVSKNKKVEKLLIDSIDSTKQNILWQQGYGNAYTYLIELFNRANVILILKDVCDEEYVQRAVNYELQNRYDEIVQVVELFEKYKNGNYKNQDVFIPELTRGFIDILIQNTP